MTNPEQHHERMPTDEEPEAHEASPRDGPRIYIASLSDYNNGILHGRWIEAVTNAEAMQSEIDEMLGESPTTAHYGDVAEEWAIHDYDGFGELRLGEYEALSTIARVARGIRVHGDAFSAYASLVGTREIDGLELFEDNYQGQWESVQAYAEHLLVELDAERAINEAPEWLQPYLKLDAAGFARDLELGGDITTFDHPDGGVWVFSA